MLGNSVHFSPGISDDFPFAVDDLGISENQVGLLRLSVFDCLFKDFEFLRKPYVVLVGKGD